MDHNEKLHIEWIGMAQPEGLVVTSATLKAAEANITWPVTELQEALREQAGKGRVVTDLPRFFAEILGWSDEYLASGRELPASLHVTIDESEHLAPKYAVKSADDDGAFVLLVPRHGADAERVRALRRGAEPPPARQGALRQQLLAHAPLCPARRGPGPARRHD
jgi:hypothetical protein